MPPSPNWSHCSVVGCLAKNGNCFLEYFTFHIQISQKIWDSNGLGIDWRTSTKLLSEGKNQHLWQVSDFPLPTRDMVFKKFYDQYFVPVLVFTRSDRGQGGEGAGDHYHHIRPVKSCLTDFTQILPLIKRYISTDFGF